MRELTRSRTSEVGTRARAVSRVQQVVEGATSKLASVATEVLGKCGRALLEALSGGEQDPARLADLARGRLQSKHPELPQALDGGGWVSSAPGSNSAWRTSTSSSRLEPSWNLRAASA